MKYKLLQELKQVLPATSQTVTMPLTATANTVTEAALRQLPTQHDHPIT
jgi:hypothetical protein